MAGSLVMDRRTVARRPDVLIIGAGVIGCSIAYHCAVAGLSVHMVERDRIGAGASGAAAGMLAPQVEAHQPDRFLDFGLAGRAEHAVLAEVLREEADIDVELRRSGVMRVALDERDAIDLRGRAVWQQERSLSATWLDPKALGADEPLFTGAAGHRLVGALWLSDECQVRSPRLVWGLAVAAMRRGVTIQEGTTVLALQRQGDSVTGVITPNGAIEAGAVVLSAGAWSGQIAVTGGLNLPVEPIKGQILAVKPLQRQPRHIIWTGDCYMAPKVDGLLVIGATEERGSFDPRPTLSGMLQLATAATDVLPEFGRLPIEMQWGGLRPATGDRLPAIGWAPGVRGLMIATAHYRNGVLLGPLTGRIVAALLQETTPPWDTAEYHPGRIMSSGTVAVTLATNATTAGK